MRKHREGPLNQEAAVTYLDDSRHRWPGQHTGQWEAHFQRLFLELRTVSHEPISMVRAALYSPHTRTARRERLLVSLIDHPHSEAKSLLEDRRIYLYGERQRFIRRLAIKRRRRRVGRRQFARSAA